MKKATQVEPNSLERDARRRSRSLQWNIATLLLLMAAVAVWTTYFRMKSETERMLAERESLRRLARELVVDDPAQYAIVERHEQWHGEDVWDVHLPEAHRYVLKLATRDIGPRNFPETEYVTTLPAGRHVISLEKSLTKERASAKVIVDDASVIEVPAVDDWFPGGGYGWGGTHTRATQSPTDKPLELIRIRFHKTRDDGSSRSSDEPYNGLFLWIERDS